MATSEQRLPDPTGGYRLKTVIQPDGAQWTHSIASGGMLPTGEPPADVEDLESPASEVLQPRAELYLNSGSATLIVVDARDGFEFKGKYDA